MKKFIIGVLVVAVIGAGVYFSMLRGVMSTTTNSQATPTVPVAKASGQVVAEAKVVPVRSAALSLPASGIVADVLVHEGDQVQAGQILVRLDSAEQQANIAVAEAAVAQAKANYQKLLEGATPEQVAAAEAAVRQSQASLRQVQSSVSPQDLQAAQAQVQQAQLQIDRLNAGPKDTDLRAAEAQLQQAQASLAGQRDQLSSAKTNAQLQLEQATNSLAQAQTSYSTARWHWTTVNSTGNDPITPSVADPTKPGKTKRNKLNDAQKQQYYDAFVQAEAALRNAEAAVQQAQVAYDNARQAEISGIAAAEQQVNASQASLDRVRAAVDADQMAGAKAQLAAARANTTKMTGTQRTSALAAAQSGVDAAQAQLDELKTGPTQSALAAAQAEIQRTEAQLTAAQVALDQTELKAPFAGSIAGLDLKPREYIALGTPVIQLADVSAWQIETSDLTELQVVNIHDHAKATITFDALPGVELSGKVLHIKGLGENRQGDIVYKVIVIPDKADQRMRWNMTASVSINPE